MPAYSGNDSSRKEGMQPCLVVVDGSMLEISSGIHRVNPSLNKLNTYV